MKLNFTALLAAFSFRAIIAAPMPVMDERDEVKVKREEVSTNAPLLNPHWLLLDERGASKRKEVDTNLLLLGPWVKLDERDETLKM
ncbi:hypothetical protein VKT23_019924 [Stygiomarasmius scandens]|uniref:Uncharacterized protein n=1 Tax=Marasmiellus scandens TaxID=2682957 RepID=A0ABR1IMA0_9AGAR